MAVEGARHAHAALEGARHTLVGEGPHLGRNTMCDLSTSGRQFCSIFAQFLLNFSDSLFAHQRMAVMRDEYGELKQAWILKVGLGRIEI